MTSLDLTSSRFANEELWFPCFVLFEIYPQSLAKELSEDLENYPGYRDWMSKFRIDESERRRINVSMFGQMGIVSRDTEDDFGIIKDSSLPEEINGVVSWRVEVSESLTVIASCFVVDDGWADMTPILKSAYAEERHQSGNKTRVVHPEEVRNATLEREMQRVIEVSTIWFKNRFHGSLNSRKDYQHKSILNLVTKRLKAFDSDHSWAFIEPLAFNPDVWEDKELSYRLKVESIIFPTNYHLIFSRIKNMISTFDGTGNTKADTPWNEGQVFIEDNIELIAWIAVLEYLYDLRTQMYAIQSHSRKLAKFIGRNSSLKDMHEFQRLNGLDLTILANEINSAMSKESWKFARFSATSKTKTKNMQVELFEHISNHSKFALSTYNGLLDYAKVLTEWRLGNINLGLQIAIIIVGVVTIFDKFVTLFKWLFLN